MKTLLGVCVLVCLTGCSLIPTVRGEGVSSVALPFRTNLNQGEDRRDFTIAARAGGASVEAVRESVRFGATRYCLPTFGGSDVAWEIDPGTQDWAFTRSGDDMIFSGRCLTR